MIFVLLILSILLVAFLIASAIYSFESETYISFGANIILVIVNIVNIIRLLLAL